jgi:hypothetical protein
MSAKRKFLTLGLILGLTILIRLPVLLEPWGADQAGYGYVAQGILEGKVPYKDTYDLTAYGVFFTFALFFKLFGTTMVSAHIGHVLASVIAVALVFLLTDRLYGRAAAIIAALAYTILTNGLAFSGFGYENKSAWGTYWYLSQREVFMAPLITAAVYLTISGERKKRILLDIGNGMLIGLAAFYKLTAVAILALVLAFIVSEGMSAKKSFGLKTKVTRVGAILAGFIVVQLPFLYYFWVHDAFTAMVQALFVHLPVYVKLSRGLRIEAFFSGNTSIWSENLVLWLVAAIAGLTIFLRDRTRANVLIAGWAIVSLLMVWGQGKFFGYHFLVLMPPLAVLTGYGLPRFLAQGRGIKDFLVRNLKDLGPAFLLATLAGTLLAFGISNYDYYRWHALYALGKISRPEYYSVFNEFPTHPYSFRSDEQVVRYLLENRRAGDRLEVVFSAGDTVIHFLTGMEPVTRFIQSWYLFNPSDVLARDETTVRLRREFVEEVINATPRFILCVHIPLDELTTLPHLKDDPNVQRLAEFIRAHYRMTLFPDHRYVFEKNPAEGAVSP